MTDLILKSDYGLPGGQVETLAEITADIDRRARQSGENYVAIGHRLIEAKNLLAHGQFKAWLEEQTGLQYRTAKNMMDAADKFKSETVSLLKPAALIELSKGNVPESARKEATARAAKGENVTKGKAKEIAKKHTEPPQPPVARKPSGGVTFDPSEWDKAETNGHATPDFYEGDAASGEWQVPTPKEAAKPLDLVIRLLGEWEKNVLENVIASDEPGTAFFDERARSGFQATVENLRSQLKTARPHAVCPICEGARCKECRNSGLVPKRLHEMLSARVATT